jgi:hypothetical protein
VASLTWKDEMTFQIAKSVIAGLGYDYPDAVERFRQAKLAHRFTGDVAPSAPALVEHAVRRVPSTEAGQPDDFVADYEVIDDMPAKTLEQRKADLIATARQAEALAMAKVISPARARLMGLDLSAVYAKPDGQRSGVDRDLLAAAQVIADQKQAIQRHGIGQEIEVEDLTEETIDAWVPTPFAA